MDLQLIWKLTKYITRNGISPKNLSAGSRCTIHHHYDETLLPKFNKKKNFLIHPHLAAVTRSSSPTPTHEVVATPRRIPFFFPPHPYPYLSFLYPGSELFLSSRPFLTHPDRLSDYDSRYPVSLLRKGKNLLIKMRA